MNDEQRREAIGLYDLYTHGDMPRRTFIRRLAALAGSVAAAEVLIGAIAADPAAAQIVRENDPRLITSTISWPLAGGRTMRGYRAAPAVPVLGRPLVIVIHENRGLNAHIRDVARRLALARFIAVAPDFLSPAGGTPADEDRAREMIGALDPAVAVADGVETIERLGAMNPRSRVGILGFCWGGGMANRLAVAASPRLRAGVSFYGPAPEPGEAARVRAQLLMILAEGDERVNRTALPWARALEAAGRGRAIVYPGVEHAFHNDASRERYNAAAAAEAWQQAVRHFNRTLRTRGA